MLIAIGVPITAAALFETILVSNAINRISPLRITLGGAPATIATNIWARYSAPPVLSNAAPNAKLATTIMITGALKARVAFRQSRHPLMIIRSTPNTALMAIGNRPRAAARTMPAMIASASGALAV